MLVLREYMKNEIQEIKELLISEKVEDLNLNEMIYIMIEDNIIIGVSKVEIENNNGNLKYLVIKEASRGQDLGNGLLRGILNKLDNNGVEKIYYKEMDSYLIKKGFYLNEKNQLELNISEFFNNGCQCSGKCNEV